MENELSAVTPLWFLLATSCCLGIFFNFFFAAYLVSPRFCHRLVGYLEEEAVKVKKEKESRGEGGDKKKKETLLVPFFSFSVVYFPVVRLTLISWKLFESGDLPIWSKTPAPVLAVTYWNLPKDATMKDVIAAIRADEDHHREVNHCFADLKKDQLNPFKPGH